jgi:hypothetical protein
VRELFEAVLWTEKSAEMDTLVGGGMIWVIWMPVAGPSASPVLSLHPFKAIQEGCAKDVSVLAGVCVWCAEESRVFTYVMRGKAAVTREDSVRMLSAMLGELGHMFEPEWPKAKAKEKAEVVVTGLGNLGPSGLSMGVVDMLVQRRSVLLVAAGI